MPSDEFERIIGEILVAIGFQEIDVTSETDDGGIDIQGKICVSDTFQLSTIARIKRWRADVQASVVQELRQILKSNQQGLIITTGEFSSSAKEEAERPESIPVTLINGAKLVQLMINHRIGIQPNEFYLFNIPNRDNSDI
jgi:restriction system protein